MKTLEQLENGKEAVIVEVDSGCGLKNKLCCLNIREGKIIKKVLSHPFRGPIVIMIDNRQCAIGRGMARSILVEER
ncbi:MAG: ferrous iron transport protein A [Nanoarchaeota archaeon]|nr:ferrous iron transport protein A [Nanoarchaeota archaeon]MBU1705096.1 ferrous iron transport protein A [Nanoarchaeota archaeon]